VFEVAGLLGDDYSQARCCYDLRRLRLRGLIVRLAHSNTYVLTDDGQRFAVFYSKVHDRLLRPLMAADHTLGMYPLVRRNPYPLLDAQVPCHIG